MNLVLCIVDNGGRHRQSGKSKSFDVFQNCSQFTEQLGKEENEGQVDVLQNVRFVFYQEFLEIATLVVDPEFVTTEKIVFHPDYLKIAKFC